MVCGAASTSTAIPRATCAPHIKSVSSAGACKGAGEDQERSDAHVHQQGAAALHEHAAHRAACHGPGGRHAVKVHRGHDTGQQPCQGVQHCAAFAGQSMLHARRVLQPFKRTCSGWAASVLHTHQQMTLAQGGKTSPTLHGLAQARSEDKHQCAIPCATEQQLQIALKAAVL